MEFEWSKEKNINNKTKHGITFQEATAIFDSIRFTAEDIRKDYGEKRFISIGAIDNTVCIVVYTLRGDTIRIISARKANSRERRKYDEQVQRSTKQ